MMNSLHKISTILIVILLSATKLSGDDKRLSPHDVERIHITTDREFYLTGETMWLSLYSFDISHGDIRYSKLSRVAYVELLNEKNVVESCKIYIDEGRGGGKIAIPLDIPTGSYKIVAYTKQMLNEEGIIFFEKEIPIIAPLSGDRLSNVNFVEEDADDLSELFSQTDCNSLDVELLSETVSVNSKLEISLKNLSGQSTSFSISVYKNDNIFTQKDKLVTIEDNIKRYKIDYSPLFSGKYLPEYEGEIIRGRVICEEGSLTDESVISLAGAGDGMNLYFSPVDSEGNVVFYTNTLVNRRELIVEPYNSPQLLSYKIDFEDPFVKSDPGSFSSVNISLNSEEILKERSFEMQVARRYGLYNNTEDLFNVKHPLLSEPHILYEFDDYRRFFSLQETVIEYIRELQFVKNPAGYALKAYWEASFDVKSTYALATKNPLVFVDGVPVYDHNLLLRYDAYKVKDIQIYPKAIYLGNNLFEGVVMINTFNKRYEDLRLSENIKILDYQAPQTAAKLNSEYISNSDDIPDIRSLLHWNPILNMEKDEICIETIYTSSLPGEYRIVIEGLTDDARPLFFTTKFIVNP